MVLGVAFLRRDRPGAGGLSGAKAAIFQFLAKQTKQKEFKPPFDFELPAQIATLRSNAYPLEQRMAALREEQRGLNNETEPQRKDLETVRAETQRLKQAAGAAKAVLKEAESRPQPDQDEIARLQIDVETKSRAWILKREEIGPKETRLNAKTGERATAIDRELGELETMLQPIRDELRTKEHDLSGQDSLVSRGHGGLDISHILVSGGIFGTPWIQALFFEVLCASTRYDGRHLQLAETRHEDSLETREYLITE